MRVYQDLSKIYIGSFVSMVNLLSVEYVRRRSYTLLLDIKLSVNLLVSLKFLEFYSQDP